LVPANCFPDPKLGSISSLRCQKSRSASCTGQRMRSDVSRTICWVIESARLRSFELRRGSLRSREACLAVAGAASEGWWSQTGSNRRPHACKARALPAELWPRTRRRMLQAGCKLEKRHMRSIKVVGLGRLELPTSRLSSARSNQLSYKPLHEEPARAHRLHADASHKRSPWRVFVREERET
jgi:hypothetical protein